MTRPSKGLDLAMIEAGKQIISESGAKKLTLKNICEKAKANPGMFIYYFKTKDVFLLKLLSSIFDEFRDFAQLNTRPKENPLERLKICLEKFSEFCSFKKRSFAELFLEIMKNKKLLEKAVLEIQNNHIMFHLILECKEKGYFNTSLPVLEIFAMMVAGGLQSTVVFGACDSHLVREKLRIILTGLLNAQFDGSVLPERNLDNEKDFDPSAPSCWSMDLSK
ncbi:MAG: TetR family transcriptional regulator [Holosporaceae bacterium]|jgi:AcrR family transcriptional regulator|nr:TetR family transcriptional regulator [Holosporaceae bacterium]